MTVLSEQIDNNIDVVVVETTDYISVITIISLSYCFIQYRSLFNTLPAETIPENTFKDSEGHHKRFKRVWRESTNLCRIEE